MTDDVSRVLAADLVDDADVAVETTLRPRTLDEYVGQREVKANLSVLLAAARGRKEAADHILLYGPPGLGKTTLATIVASVVLPRPGGPYRRMWSAASFLPRAAASSTDRLALTSRCPTYSSSVRGRRVVSTATSASSTRSAARTRDTSSVIGRIYHAGPRFARMFYPFTCRDSSDLAPPDSKPSCEPLHLPVVRAIANR